MSAVPAVLLAIAIGASAYWAGDNNRNNAWLASQAQTAREASATLSAAQARGDRLSKALLHSEHQISQLRTEVHHALNKTTTGSPCLNGATLRLLNQAPGLAVSGVPWTASGAAAAGGSFAADTGDNTTPHSAWYSTTYSTDTQIASWIADAGSAYRICKARLDTLIDWHLEEKKSP